MLFAEVSWPEAAVQIAGCVCCLVAFIAFFYFLSKD